MCDGLEGEEVEREKKVGKMGRRNRFSLVVSLEEEEIMSLSLSLFFKKNEILFFFFFLGEN